MTPAYAVRPVRADEWPEARALRLRSLADELASVAFLETHDAAAARPDEFWQERTANSSLDAGDRALARQFVAVAEDGEWVGTVVALVEQAGETDVGGRPVEEPGGYVAAVWLAPEHRGRGVLDDLLAAATGWLRARGLPRARLFVHTENPRARRAYEKAGFGATGAQITAVNGPELEMELRLDDATR